MFLGDISDVFMEFISLLKAAVSRFCYYLYSFTVVVVFFLGLVIKRKAMNREKGTCLIVFFHFVHDIETLHTAKTFRTVFLDWCWILCSIPAVFIKSIVFHINLLYYCRYFVYQYMFLRLLLALLLHFFSKIFLLLHFEICPAD